MTIADLYNALEKAVDSGVSPESEINVDCGIFGYMSVEKSKVMATTTDKGKCKIFVLKIV